MPTRCQEDIIQYRQITLKDDFLGPIPANIDSKEGDAYAFCGIKLSKIGFDFINEKAKKGNLPKYIRACLTDVTAFSIMDRCQSWSIKKKWSNELRKHEQGHFDISEIWARKLDKKLQEMVRNELCGRGRTEKEAEADLKKDIDNLFETYVEDEDEMQKKYDKETKNGKNNKQQTSWNEKLSDLLKSV